MFTEKQMLLGFLGILLLVLISIVIYKVVKSKEHYSDKYFAAAPTKSDCVVCQQDDSDDLCAGACYPKTKKCVNGKTCEPQKVTPDGKTCCADTQNICGNQCYDPKSQTCMPDSSICDNTKLTSDGKTCCSGPNQEACSTGCFDSTKQKCICPQ
jgi:hypothetical protein